MSHSPYGRRLSLSLYSTSFSQSPGSSRKELLALLIAGFMLLQPMVLMAQRQKAAASQSSSAPQKGRGVIAPKPPAPSAALTSGNLVVYRVGTGAAALAGTATSVFLDEYTPAGTFVQSIPLPTTTVGSQHALTSSGTSSAEGMMTRSADGRYLILPGYDAALGAAIATTASNRVLARVDATGAIDTSTFEPGSAGNIRSATSTDGTTLWYGASNNGYRSTTFGSSSASTSLNSTLTNGRTINIFNGQLYCGTSTGTNTFKGVNTIGTGTPTTSGQTITRLPGLSDAANPSSYNFFFADLSVGVSGLDTLYIADDSTNTIQKWSLVGSTWTLNGNITASGVRGLTGVVQSGTVVLFGSTGGTGSTGGGTIYTVQDTTGYNAAPSSTTATTIATAATNTAFRGIAFAPISGGPTLSINDVSLNEGNAGTTSFTFTVSLSAAAGPGGVTFDIATADGTATQPSDYTQKSLTSQTIPAGNSTYSFTVLVNGDTTPETNETFFVNVTNVTGATVADGQGQGTIVNDDAAPNLTINDVTLNEGNAGTTTFTFTVSLSAPAPGGGVTFDIATADGTATQPGDYTQKSLTSQTIPAGSSTYAFDVLVNGDTTPEPNETFFVNVTNVTNAIVTDGQGLGTIANDDFTPIHDIQGNGSTSPLVGTSVFTRGIVTGIKSGSSGGFFIQEPDATVDADPNTSEGLFVFTGSSVPAGTVVGNLVQVSGTVQEFIPSADPNQKPHTELSGTISVSVVSTGNTLPAAVTITAADTLVNNLENLEKYEGMRVTVPSFTVVAPTQGTITENSATVSSNGVFYGVVTGVARPFREPGINASDPLPAGAPGTVPRFDENPERLRVDSDAQPGTTALNVSAGSVLTNVTGPLEYGFRTWTIDPDTTLTGTNGGATVAPTPTASEFTVASFNMERFFNNVADPGESGAPTLTTTAYNNRLNKASLIIRTVQRYPDVIGVEEMENLATLTDVANKVNGDAVSVDGLSNPNYQPYLVEGNDVGGIDVGFLVKTTNQLDGTPRVSVVDVAQFGKTTTFTNPDSSTSLLNDRPPLVLRATIARPAAFGGGSVPFTVIVNHLRSLSNIDDTTAGSNGWPTEGDRVRNKRRAQAEYLANLIQARQTADPTEKIITVGDMNAFRVNDGYVDVIGTILGTPAPATQVTLASSDLVNPDQTDLVDTVTADQQYSYSFDGNAQTLDHIIVNPSALAIKSRFAYAREDADQPVKDYENAAIPDRISDHDQPLVYLSFLAPATAGQILISEFRLRGLNPNGAQNEFIEIYNNSDSPHTVFSSDASGGYGVAASDGVLRCTIPNGTVIPARGHYLCANSVGYSIGNYPAGSGTTATADATYTTDIPDNAGIALFNSTTTFTLANRLDAVGSTSEANTLYKEGTGYPALTPSSTEYSLVRDLCGKGGSVATFGPCPTGPNPRDTNNNATDFFYVDTNGTPAGMGQNLGAPGPENLSSPIQRNALFSAFLLDTTAGSGSSPNRVRDFTNDPANNSTFGTLALRKRIVNNTGGNVTRLRYRIVDLTTFPAPSGIADLRPRTSSLVVISGINDAGTCLASNGVATTPCTVNVQGTTLEQPPTQLNGGGFNSTLSSGTITLGAPLANGASINVQFLLGVQQAGKFKFFINIEALP